ncbi:MAG TPA: MGMT family protein [Magnetospirillaceae bacterium]|nr:MGMT family protein [Magnetospirillaceae bacterium]
MSDTGNRIRAVLKSIPRGRVVSYGEAAARAGVLNGGRTTARILHACSRADGLPWHRVVRSDGRIALLRGNGFELQKTLLEAEGVVVSPDGRVDLERHRWR